MEAVRHGPSAQVEQIDEVGIVTQVGVQDQRFGVDRFDGVDGAGGWHKQQVDVAPQRGDLLLVGPELVVALVGVNGGEVAAAFDDGPRGREQFLRPGGDKGFDGGISLGDPRPTVQQVSRFDKGLIVNLDFFAAQIGHVLDGFMKEAGVIAVAEKLELFRDRYAKAKGAAFYI